MNSSRFHTQERWLEKSFWASESFVTNGDNLTVRKFVRFFQSRGRSSSLHFLFNSGGERITSFSQDLHQVISQITSSKIQSEDSVWKSITFINWDSVRNTISG